MNEAFAPQVLAVLTDEPIPTDKLNVNGGAIALGHPIGCTGTRIIVTLLHEMRRRKARAAAWRRSASAAAWGWRWRLRSVAGYCRERLGPSQAGDRRSGKLGPHAQ